MEPGDREQRIRERAFALWEAGGREPGRELDYWLAAKRELAALEEQAQSDAGEEDPLAGVDEEPPGTFAPKAPR